MTVNYFIKLNKVDMSKLIINKYENVLFFLY